GSRTFDDEFVAPAEPFALVGGGRRIEISFGEGYPYAQVYAPDDDDVIAFGYHPYFRLPGIERSAWAVEIPVSERVVLDSEELPTGAVEKTDAFAGPLGSRTFDDEFAAPGEPFVLAGGGRRIEVSFVRGYPYAQIYAPEDDEVIAFEPMTAPTNALVSGRDLNLLQPGESYEASFSVTVMSA
ncbi:MAG TPA: hypothetical protein VLB79_06100, partial [Solirubrobacterales bacterium]|nr:hypothetical protein [Solirubrobacterales bacterium]